jgi:hypothetical protein
VSAADLLRDVVRALDGAGIPHMLVGSFASSSYGALRATQDIDIVIDPTAEALELFIMVFDEDRFYLNPDAAQLALADRDQFNLIDVTTGWKVDLMIRKERPFSRSEFARRTRITILDVDVWVATAEDTVLAKLEWAAMGGSDRQVVDASTVLSIGGADLDQDYLDHWAAELGIPHLLAKARS